MSLSQAEMSGHFLSGADYFEQTFVQCHRSHTQYRDVTFEDCQFVECDFSGSAFVYCRWVNCTFTRCQLNVLDLTGSHLFGIQFDDCKMMGIDWTKADWPVYHLDFELTFHHCLLSDSSFFGLTLQEVNIRDSKLHDVDFREGDFTQGQFYACDLTRSLFMRTNLTEADFSDSENYDINVLENTVRGAKFSRYEALNLLLSLGIELVD